MRRSGSLLIDGGDLPSLAAAGLEIEPESLILWHWRERTAAGERRRDIVHQRAAAFGAAQVIEHDATPHGAGLSIMLTIASDAALAVGCSRIVWPATSSGSVPIMGREVERAQLISILVGLDVEGTSIDIDLPLVDLTDAQLVELADDSGLPLDLFWPCGTGLQTRESPFRLAEPENVVMNAQPIDDIGRGPRHRYTGLETCATIAPCGECDGCERWQAAFAGAGVAWPWERSTVKRHVMVIGSE